MRALLRVDVGNDYLTYNRGRRDVHSTAADAACADDHQVVVGAQVAARLAGMHAIEQRADDAERHQHTGAGIADRRPGLDRPAVALAGDAHRPSRTLRDRIERQTLLVRAAVSEALDLGIDDARIDRAHDVLPEPQPPDRTG